MTATIAEERIVAERNSEEGPWAVFQGRNRIRFFIAAWPKIAQQLVGLSVFNTYATYFCEYLSFRTVLSLCSYCSSSICWQQRPIHGNGHFILCPVDIYDDNCCHHGQAWSPSVDDLPLCSYICVSFMPRNYWLLRLYQAINQFTSGKPLSRNQRNFG